MYSCNLWKIVALAAGVILLTACDGQKSGTGGQQPGAAVPAPGDDDDRPVTVLGGSLILDWRDSQNWDALPQEGRRYKYSVSTANGGPGAAVSLITYRYDPANDDPREIQFRRIDGKDLTIEVDYKPGDGSAAQKLQLGTDPNGQNLDIVKVPGSATFAEYKRLAKRTRRHPDRTGKITVITLKNVAVDSGNKNNTACSQTGDVVTCIVNAASGTTQNGCSLEISVCKGSSCP